MQLKKMNLNAIAVAALAVCTVSAIGQKVGPSMMIGAAMKLSVLQPDGVEPPIGVAPPFGIEGEDPQKDDLLDGLDKLGANAKERNEVNLDKNMMSLVASRKGARYADLSQKIDLISVRSYEFAGKGMYSKADLDVLRRKLDGNGWSHLVRNESNGETNDIVVKATGDGFISDMVILNAESKELNIVHLRGHFKMDDVNGAMSSAMSVSMGAGAGAMGMAMGVMSTGSHHSAPPPPPPAPPAPPAEPKK